jgi:altronate dehydratase large subunit
MVGNVPSQEVCMERHVVKLDPRDNVATALSDLTAGTEAKVDDEVIVLNDAIPFGHKFALCSLEVRDPVIKYGAPIGWATSRIKGGDHTHIHNVRSYRSTTGAGNEGQEYPPLPARDTGLSPGAVGSQRPSPLPHMPKPVTVMGYRRPDGTVGIRNHVLILPTVSCANTTAGRIGHLLDGAVTITHPYGCTQLGADLEQTRRVLLGFATHPNVAAVVLVSLGCETMPAQELHEQVSSRGKAVLHLTVQEEGGTGRTVEKAVDWAEAKIEEAVSQPRESVYLHELIMGTECGGSDSLSGLTANPAVGLVSDLVVACGGTVILSETPEFIGAEHLLVRRAANEVLGESILQIVADRERQAAIAGVDLRGAQPTPGNMAGGLTTIEEKSLGAIRKGGTAPIQEVVPYAVHPSQTGLVIMDTPGYDPASVTAMVAGGAQLVVFTTGRGSPAGSPIAPVIKVSSNSEVHEHLQEHIDVDCGGVLDGRETIEDVGQRIFRQVIAVANGRLTKAETTGHHDFAIARLGFDL